MLYEFEKVCLKHQSSDYIFQTVTRRRLSDVYHKHDFYEWIIVLDGSCVQKVNFEERLMQKNDCGLLCPDDYHCFVSQSNDINILSLSVERNEALRFCRLFDVKDNVLKQTFIPLSQRQVRTIYELYYSSKEYEYKLLHANLLSFYIEAMAPKDSLPLSVHLAMNEMTKHENLRAGVDRFVELSFYSRSHLNRLMKENLKITVHEFIKNARLDAAYHLLISSDTDIVGIAEEVGYESLSHFGKVFKERYGLSPSEVRKHCGIKTI